MWGWVVAAALAGAAAAWAWATDSPPPRRELPPARDRFAPRATADDFARTEAWASQFVPQRLPLAEKLRLLLRAFRPVVWPDYALRVGHQLGVV